MRTASSLLVAVFFVLHAGGCGSDAADSSDAAGAATDAPDGLATVFGGDRPTELRVPDAYDGSEALPLVVVLHGYSATGLVQLAYSRIGELVNDQNVLVMAPDGLVNADGKQYWNATAACCDFDASGVDDATYLRGLIDDVSAEYNVDAKRIFLWGHSNGGFMAHRMACDHADVIAGIVSLAGTTHLSPADCVPSEPVSILQIHGDADSTILYEGGAVCAEAQCSYPGAEAAAEQWATNNGCSATRTTDATRLDLDSTVDGDETRIERHDGCPAGGGVELWVIEGGEHIPVLRANFDDLNWDWFAANAKP